jgi:hypothetical protein
VSMKRQDLRAELLRRQKIDQAARRGVDRGPPERAARLLEVDADNTAWLKRVIETVGWPGCSLVGDDGAHAAWLLAQHADRDPDFQRRCLELLEWAVAEKEASPLDLAYMTDRVHVNSGTPQAYGTQLTARDGRFVVQRLQAPDSVDARRAAVGLEPLDDYLRRAADRYGSPVATAIRCRTCGGGVPVWLPAPGEATTVACPACGGVMTVRGYPPGARLPRGARRLSDADLAGADGRLES